MAQSGKDTQKQEEGQTKARGRRLWLDQLREDGIRKELYKYERKAQGDWEKRWGFLQNSEKLQQEEIAKQGFFKEFYLQGKYQTTSTAPEDVQPVFELLPSEKFPVKSSGMIGWRLFTLKNDLNRLVGPMYVSPKLTMNPPLGPEEPDISQQKIIYLG